MKYPALALLAGCSWLPADSPPKQPVKTDPQIAEVAHSWTVENHVLAGNATISDADALENHGRTVEITPTSYRSFSVGNCEESARERHDRVFADLLADLDLAGEARDTAIRFGFGDPVTEYRLTCPGNPKAMPLVIEVSGNRAMTCFGGVCYLLAR